MYILGNTVQLMRSNTYLERFRSRLQRDTNIKHTQSIHALRCARVHIVKYGFRQTRLITSKYRQNLYSSRSLFRHPPLLSSPGNASAYFAEKPEKNSSAMKELSMNKPKCVFVILFSSSSYTEKIVGSLLMADQCTISYSFSFLSEPCCVYLLHSYYYFISCLRLPTSRALGNALTIQQQQLQSFMDLNSLSNLDDSHFGLVHLSFPITDLL